MRFAYSILLLLPLCQTVFAAEPVHFGQQTLFFPETQVAIRFHCDDKPQVNWSLESADRKVMSGAARVRDGGGTVEFQTPPLKAGVTLPLKLAIDGKTEPFILVSPDVFAGQKEWLENLNIILIDGDDEKAATVFESEGIPFKTSMDGVTKGALILVTNKEISSDYCLWTTQGNHVIVVAPEEKGHFVLPQWDCLLETSFLITNQTESLFKNNTVKQGQKLDQVVLRNIHTLSYYAPNWFMLDTTDHQVIFRAVPPGGTSNTGWLFADFQFGENRLLFVTTPLFDHWETSPAARLFLKMLFEELEPHTQAVAP